MHSKFGIDADYSVGSTGDFEVTADGGKVFSKRSLGRFPKPGEVEELVETLAKG